MVLTTLGNLKTFSQKFYKTAQPQTESHFNTGVSSYLSPNSHLNHLDNVTQQPNTRYSDKHRELHAS